MEADGEFGGCQDEAAVNSWLPSSLLKGRYRVSNCSSWLDTLVISGHRQSSKQVNKLFFSLRPPTALFLRSLIYRATNTSAAQGLAYLARTPTEPTRVLNHILADSHCTSCLPTKHSTKMIRPVFQQPTETVPVLTA